MKKSFKCTLCTALVLLLLLTVGCSSNIANKGQDVVVKIESGMNSKDIADLLVIKGVLPSNNYFALIHGNFLPPIITCLVVPRSRLT